MGQPSAQQLWEQADQDRQKNNGKLDGFIAQKYHSARAKAHAANDYDSLLNFIIRLEDWAPGGWDTLFIEDACEVIMSILKDISKSEAPIRVKKDVNIKKSRLLARERAA